MRTAAAAFFLSVLVGALVTPLVRGLARRFELLDHALTSRKVHGRPVPRLGGVAIVTAFFAPMRVSNANAVVLLFMTGYAFGRITARRPWLVGCGMVVLGLLLVGLTMALGG